MRIGTNYEKWQKLVTAAVAKLNKYLGRVPHYASIFKEAGFVGVVEKQTAWPVGTWAKDERMKELGRYDFCLPVSPLLHKLCD